jgi:hypothetical protein
MYALVANGIQAICKTQRKLETMIAIYAYPKFCKCNTEDEARAWIRKHSRPDYANKFSRYGTTSENGYAQVEYFISKECIYYNVDTSRLGFVKVCNKGNNTSIDARSNLIKVKISNIGVDDRSIVSHVIAIRRILIILGTIIDVDVIVPDISVYLAATKYTGRNYMIKGLQKDIADRIGGVSFTVREMN